MNMWAATGWMFQKTRIPVDLSAIVREKHRETQMNSKLYYDLGSGLSEQDVLEKQFFWRETSSR